MFLFYSKRNYINYRRRIQDDKEEREARAAMIAGNLPQKPQVEATVTNRSSGNSR